MGKIQINPSLKRLSKDEFRKWFEGRKKASPKRYGEANLEDHYNELHPTVKKEVKEEVKENKAVK